MALIISVPRRLAEGVRMVQTGQWHGWGPSGLMGHRLGGKVLGIVGMGRIGQAVAHRARAFGLDVVYHNRRPLPAALENMLGARYEADLDAMIAGADILTFHCPASAETRHLLDARRIAGLKPDAYVINTARGDLIDEEALIAALYDGRIGGGGPMSLHTSRTSTRAGCRCPMSLPCRIWAAPLSRAARQRVSASSPISASGPTATARPIRCWRAGFSAGLPQSPLVSP